MLEFRSILIIFLFPFFVYGQKEFIEFGPSEWDSILTNSDFKIVKKKDKIPIDILQGINIGDLSLIANPKKKCNLGCLQTEGIPNIRLNWAASDKENWIISITTGGYSISTKYFLIPKNADNNIEITCSLYNFKDFRYKYLIKELW